STIAGIAVGTHRMELDALALDHRPIEGHRRQHRLVAAIAQADGQPQVGVQVSERSERGQDDAPAAEWTTRGLERRFVHPGRAPDGRRSLSISLPSFATISGSASTSRAVVLTLTMQA